MESRAEAAVLLRDMTSADLAAAHALSRQAQWPHRLEDWDLMLRIGLGVVAERDGVVVGTTLAWPYGEDAATLGMVIVAPECRGAGVGRKLMTAMFERLDGRAIQLNATNEGLALYKSLGFATVGGIHQHQGAAFSVPIVSLRRGERVRPLGSGDEAAIVELDRQATGFQRGEMLAELLKTAQGVVLDRGGAAVGFALFRRFGMGYSVGPVVAPEAHGAKVLISHWLGSNAGMFTRLDVPYESGLSGWLEGLGVPDVGLVTTMVRGEAPARDGSVAAFAITSQALG
jgi:predicted N-acetyltransferase YhbS